MTRLTQVATRLPTSAPGVLTVYGVLVETRRDNPRVMLCVLLESHTVIDESCCVCAQGSGGGAVPGHRRQVPHAAHPAQDHGDGHLRPGKVPQGAPKLSLKFVEILFGIRFEISNQSCPYHLRMLNNGGCDRACRSAQRGSALEIHPVPLKFASVHALFSHSLSWLSRSSHSFPYSAFSI